MYNIIDNMMDGDGYEITGQIDYTHPFGNENKIGFEYRTRNFKSPIFIRSGINVNNGSIGLELPVGK